MNFLELIVEGYKNAIISIPPHKYYCIYCNKTMLVTSKNKHNQGVTHTYDKNLVQQRLIGIKNVKSGVLPPKARVIGVINLDLQPEYIKTLNEKFDDICDFYEI